MVKWKTGKNEPIMMKMMMMMMMVVMVITINSCVHFHGQGTWREILMVPAKILTRANHLAPKNIVVMP